MSAPDPTVEREAMEWAAKVLGATNTMWPSDQDYTTRLSVSIVLRPLLAELARLREEKAKDAHALRTRPDYNFRCQDCGAPHNLDTSIPSPIWNAICENREGITPGAAGIGMPEVGALCTLCIDDRLQKAGLTAEAEFYFGGSALKSRLYADSHGDVQALRAELSSLKAEHEERVKGLEARNKSLNHMLEAYKPRFLTEADEDQIKAWSDACCDSHDGSMAVCFACLHKLRLDWLAQLAEARAEVERLKGERDSIEEQAQAAYRIFKRDVGKLEERLSLAEKLAKAIALSDCGSMDPHRYMVGWQETAWAEVQRLLGQDPVLVARAFISSGEGVKNPEMDPTKFYCIECDFPKSADDHEIGCQEGMRVEGSRYRPDPAPKPPEQEIAERLGSCTLPANLPATDEVLEATMRHAEGLFETTLRARLTSLEGENAKLRAFRDVQGPRTRMAHYRGPDDETCFACSLFEGKRVPWPCPPIAALDATEGKPNA